MCAFVIIEEKRDSVKDKDKVADRYKDRDKDKHRIVKRTVFPKMLQVEK